MSDIFDTSDTTLRSVPVDFSCDQCGTFLVRMSLANLLRDSSLLTSAPTRCSVCRDLSGWMLEDDLRERVAANRPSVKGFAALGLTPDGAEWDERETTDTGPHVMDVLAPLLGVSLLVVIIYAIYGWLS